AILPSSGRRPESRRSKPARFLAQRPLVSILNPALVCAAEHGIRARRANTGLRGGRKLKIEVRPREFRGHMMKRLGIVLLATVGLAAMAQAADLPTTKAPAAAPPNCWSSFWTWLNSSASDCPLSAYGITLYGTLDVNGTYLSQGAARSPSADKVYYGIQKAANGPHYLFGYNGLSTNVVGLKMKEDILPYGWSLIGVLEAGVNPYSGMFFNGPRSLADTTSARPGLSHFRPRTWIRAARDNGTTRRPILALAIRPGAR